MPLRAIAREPRAIFQHQFGCGNVLPRQPLLDHLRRSRRVAGLLETANPGFSRQREKQLSRHDVVRKLVDIAHHIGKWRGFAGRNQFRFGGRRGKFYRSLPFAAGTPPDAGEHAANKSGVIEQRYVPHAVIATARKISRKRDS